MVSNLKNIIETQKLSVIFFVSITCVFITNLSLASQCLYVSSYHKGYEWNDGIERGIESILEGKCNLDKIYMDTKKNVSIAHAKEMASLIKEHILTSKPDVVIACDDNASKYLIEPYFKNSVIPIIFCGINWSVEAYGYPYSNSTGIIEVAPIKPLLEEIDHIVKNPRKGIYLSSDVFTEHKDFERYKEAYAHESVEIKGIFVKTYDEWKSIYEKIQKTNIDFIVLGNNAGINDWNVNDAMQYTQENTKILSVSNYDWMMPYTMLGMAKLPEEQGVWAAKVAISILDGFPINEIPIVVNRKWEIYINPYLFSKANISIPKELARKAVSLDYQ